MSSSSIRIALPRPVVQYADPGLRAAMGQEAKRKIGSYSVPAAAEALLSAVEAIGSRK
jgi:hypothetical protein